MEKKEVFTVRCRKDNGYTSRVLSAKNKSAVIDRALTLYKETWKKYPDSMKLTQKL